MTIRPERAGDAAAIYALHAASFATVAEGRLVDRLRAAGRLVVSLVAEIDGAIIGHVAFSPVTVPNSADAVASPGAGLAPVAVAAGQRRRGVAAVLIREGLAACKAAGFGWTVVLGEPLYYGRFGFQPAAGFGLIDEYGGGPAFAVLELTVGAAPRGAGVVRYAPEFASLEEVSD